MSLHYRDFTKLLTRITNNFQFRKTIVKPVLVGIAFTAASSVHANQNYMNDFNANYGTQGTNIDSCGVCHTDFNGNNSPLNLYGQDWTDNEKSFGQIDNFDSDGDGTDNLGEITPEFMPGWNCVNYEQAQNAPANLNEYVDPANPGCGVQPALVDLDIAQFRVTKNVRLAHIKPIGISLVVINNGDSERSAPATIIGIQNGIEVYIQTQTVSDGIGNGRTTVDFLSYTPDISGEIVWTATIADEDPDDDVAIATTNVR